MGPLICARHMLNNTVINKTYRGQNVCLTSAAKLEPEGDLLYVRHAAQASAAYLDFQDAPMSNPAEGGEKKERKMQSGKQTRATRPCTQSLYFHCKKHQKLVM